MSKISKANESFSVTLFNKRKGIDQRLSIKEDEFILDIAEENQMQLPYSCRAGACFDCLCKVVEGKVEQTEKALEFLKPEEIRAGYILMCAASPRSNCVIETHQAEELFGEDE